jgi:multiple sugar transport system ATP-binding protein
VASLTLEHVQKAFATRAVVHDLTLEIADGELLVIVGPSGCGKSTVLRLIAGLERPDSGRVLIDGHDATAFPPQDRDLAMVFQNYALYPHMTVRQNMAFGLKVRGVDAGAVAERVERTAASLGLEALLDRRPSQLSGGQRQRVALGRAIVRQPKAFLLDEPLSNLDPVLRIATRAELGLLQRRLKSTMVYVTHDQEEAMTLGTRIAIMSEGRIEQLGAPLDLFERPASTFVAQFVGSPAMNLWPATLTADGSQLQIEGSPSLVPLRGVVKEARQIVTAGVRPHDLTIVNPEAGQWHGRIEIVERLGAQTVIHVTLDGISGLARASVPSATAASIDDRIGIALPSIERLHLFDSEGRRVEGTAACAS